MVSRKHEALLSKHPKYWPFPLYFQNFCYLVQVLNAQRHFFSLFNRGQGIQLQIPSENVDGQVDLVVVLNFIPVRHSTLDWVRGTNGGSRESHSGGSATESNNTDFIISEVSSFGIYRSKQVLSFIFSCNLLASWSKNFRNCLQAGRVIKLYRPSSSHSHSFLYFSSQSSLTKKAVCGPPRYTLFDDNGKL